MLLVHRNSTIVQFLYTLSLYAIFVDSAEESLVDNEIQELKSSYVVVYSICFLCQSDGKSPHCKQPSNMAKRRKM